MWSADPPTAGPSREQAQGTVSLAPIVSHRPPFHFRPTPWQIVPRHGERHAGAGSGRPCKPFSEARFRPPSRHVFRA
jgi:hypothetical protein